jgi:Na+-transporting methylmalonyl-CoA/oxaloacetate decarboxylase beta subunit
MHFILLCVCSRANADHFVICFLKTIVNLLLVIILYAVAFISGIKGGILLYFVKMQKKNENKLLRCRRQLLWLIKDSRNEQREAKKSDESTRN